MRKLLLILLAAWPFYVGATPTLVELFQGHVCMLDVEMLGTVARLTRLPIPPRGPGRTLELDLPSLSIPVHVYFDAEDEGTNSRNPAEYLRSRDQTSFMVWAWRGIPEHYLDVVLFHQLKVIEFIYMRGMGPE